MSEGLKTIVSYLSLPATIVSFLGAMLVLMRVILKLNKINENVQSIPEMKKQMADMGDTLNKQNETLKSTIESLKAIKEDLDNHTQQDAGKAVLAMWNAKDRLLRYMRKYIAQGHISVAQFAELKELYELYVSLGGNHEVTIEFERVSKLRYTEDLENEKRERRKGEIK